MAHYSKENGIILSVEEKETFQECHQKLSSPSGIKTPNANRIIKWVIGDLPIYKLEE